MEQILDNYNYWISIVLMLIGFYAVINGTNFIKKLMGLAIFQTSVLLFYIGISHVEGGKVPIIKQGLDFYVNPLPHVLMLTAIVVGVATMSVGLALVVRIKEEYGTIEEDEILAQDYSPPLQQDKKNLPKKASTKTATKKYKRGGGKK